MLETAYQVTVPQETVNDETVRIAGWKVACGTVVAKDQIICEIETSKIVLEIAAPAAGVVQYSFATGSDVRVGDTLCSIVPSEDSRTSPITTATSNGQKSSNPLPANQQFDNPAATSPARFTPLARRLAQEYNIDVNSFSGGSLVRKNDILRKAGMTPAEPAVPQWFAEQKTAASDATLGPLSLVSLTANPVPGVAIKWKDLSRRKVAEGKVLQGGKSSCVQSSLTISLRAPALRSRLKKLQLPTTGFDALIMFEVSRLLRKFPVFNAVYDNHRIGEYKEVNIGWAIDSGDGLLVPVVCACDQKSLREIVSTCERQFEAYLEHRLTSSDFSGGTFTISNLSGDSIAFFNPLISQGQSAILGVGGSSDREGDLFYFTLAFDHQVAEGKTAALFLRELSARLEAHNLLEVSPTPKPDPSSEQHFCALCQRDAKALQRLKAVLLKSEVPAGLVCSLCISGL